MQLSQFKRIALFIGVSLLLIAASSRSPLDIPQQQGVQDTCFGSWVWDTSNPTFAHWRAPFVRNLLGSIDFRSLPQMGSPGPIAQGSGFFTYNVDITDPLMICFGGNIDGSLLVTEKASIEAVLGLDPGSLQATTTRSTLRELLLEEADPTGQIRWKPLRISSRNGMKLYLGGFGLLLDEPFRADHPAIQTTLAVRWADYRRHKAAGTPLEVLQRWTGNDMLKLFGRVGDDLLPALLPPEYQSDGWKPRDTIILDIFNRTNSASLGSSSEGWSWTENNGSWSIGTNAAEVDDNQINNHARAESDLSSDDHYSQAVLLTTGHSEAIGVLARMATANFSNFYWGRVDFSATPDSWQTYSRVSGTYTAIGVNTGVNVVVNDVIRIMTDDSSITRRRNGADQDTVTNTALTGQLRCGIGSWTSMTGARMDDFEAADLAVVVETYSYMAMLRQVATYMIPYYIQVSTSTWNFTQRGYTP